MVEFEEEAYSKPVFILLAILVIVAIVIILNIMTGGILFQLILCGVVGSLPLGDLVASYLGCYAIPI